ncbi:MAG: Ig-like domain-containing protein, partial [Fimbriimonadaceae bacterium]
MTTPLPKVWACLAFASCLNCFALAADMQPPAVAITQPTPGATLTGKTTVTMTTSDASGVTNVVLKVDGATISSPLQGPPYSFLLDTTKLANGMHTMHAVATDAAGNAARSAIITFTVTNRPAYTLGSGPFVVEDLGSMLSANTQEGQIMFRLPSNNETHLLLYYDLQAVGKYNLEILDVNLTRGTAILTNGPKGRPSGRSTVLYSNEKIYLATSDPGYLFEYDPVTGATNQISKLTQLIAQRMQIGDDGWIYIGETSTPYMQGGVDRYNPNTGVFEYLGRMDTNYAGTALQYAYTLGADTRYLYVGLGQSPWYLAIYDTQTGSNTLYWKTNIDTGGTVHQGKAGGYFYERYTNALQSIPLWYHLTNGVPLPMAAGSVPPLLSIAEQNNVVYDAANFPSTFTTEINLDAAYPDSSTDRAVVKWRSVGTTNWSSVSMTGFNLQPVSIKRVYTWQNGKMFGFADFYGPVFSYDPGTRKTETLGRPPFSLYDALIEEGTVYLSGYADATLRYDTQRTWTLTGSTSDQSISNPWLTTVRFGKYHFYTAFGSDGLVYIGAHHERNSAGGELGWYDPISGTSGSLRDPFLNDDVRDLKPALGGTKLVFSSNNEKLFVFDVASK